MICADIVFVCTVIGGVAGLLAIIESVTKLCMCIYKRRRKKNARPVDETEQAS